MATPKDIETLTEMPWSDPNHDVVADIKDWLQREYEKWPVPAFKPFYTPAEQRLIDEWKKNETN